MKRPPFTPNRRSLYSQSDHAARLQKLEEYLARPWPESAGQMEETVATNNGANPEEAAVFLSGDVRSSGGYAVVQGLSEEVAVTDGVNFDVGTGTGTQFGTSAGAKVGFSGATPSAPIGPFTQTYSTANTTLSAYTPDDESAAYTGIDNAAVGTVYAQLVDLNALRAATENLRALTEDLAQFVNSAVDALQTKGLLS